MGSMQSESPAGRITVRLMRNEDIPACRKMLVESFPVEATRNAEAFAELEEEPWYAPSHRFVAELASPAGAQLVGHVGLRVGELWIAGHPFPAGRIGMLAVKAEFRRIGIGRLLVEGACDELRRRGRPLVAVSGEAALSGAGFFGKLGFRRSVAVRPLFQIELGASLEALKRLAPSADASLFIRLGGPQDVPVFDSLHFQHYSRLTGGWSRSARFWLRRLLGKPKLWIWPVPEFFLAYRESGKASAYAAVCKAEDSWEVLELASVAGHEGLAAALVAKLAAQAAEARVPAIKVDTSHADLVAHSLAVIGLRGGGRYEPVFLKVLDADAALELVEEPLQLRALGEGFSVRLETEASRAIELGRGTSDTVMCASVEDIILLSFNGAILDESLALGRLRLSPDTPATRAIARRLFPETYALRLRLDEY